MSYFSEQDRATILANATALRGRYEKPMGALVDGIVNMLRKQWLDYLAASGEPAFRATAAERLSRDVASMTRDEIVEALVPRPATKDFDGYVTYYGFDPAAFEAAPVPPPAAGAKPHGNARDKALRKKLGNEAQRAGEAEDETMSIRNAFVCMWSAMSATLPEVAESLGISLGTLNNYFKGRTKPKLDARQAEILKNMCDLRAGYMRTAAEAFNLHIEKLKKG